MLLNNISYYKVRIKGFIGGASLIGTSRDINSYYYNSSLTMQFTIYVYSVKVCAVKDLQIRPLLPLP